MTIDRARAVTASVALLGVAYGCGAKVAGGERLEPAPDASVELVRAPGPTVTPKIAPSGTPAPTTPGCPMDVSRLTFTFQPRGSFGQNRCTDSQVRSLVACLMTDRLATTPVCKSMFDARENIDCASCLETGGPLVDRRTNEVVPNVAGCIANAQADTSQTGCGALVDLADQCVETACAPPLCLRSEYATCVDEARRTVCSTYEARAQCKLAELARGNTAAVCAGGATPIDDAVTMATLFCGAGLGDAAVPRDATTDG